MKIKLTERQRQAAEILSEALNGNRKAQERLIEGISTSDFPVQLAPALNTIALGNYNDQPKIWQEWAQRETLDDFRQNEYRQFAWDETDPDIEPSTHGEQHFAGGLARVPEYGEYPVIRFEATSQGLKLKKNGVQIKLSWESIVNDRQFNLLRRIPAEFGRRAAVQEDVEATRPLVSTTNFSVGNGNLITADLTLEGLKAAFLAISNQTYNGNKVTNTGPYKLIVTPQNEIAARELLAIQSIETITTPEVGVEQRTVTGNPMSGKFEIVVNPYYEQLGGTATDWFLIPAPGSTPNPSVVNAFLAGHESPEIFIQKTTTGDPVDGAFLDDSYSTKTRHVVTGGFIQPGGTMKATA